LKDRISKGEKSNAGFHPPILFWWRSFWAGDGDGLAGSQVTFKQESVVRVFKIRLIYRREIVVPVKISRCFRILEHGKKKYFIKCWLVLLSKEWQSCRKN
jgi:hypothetical protein